MLSSTFESIYKTHRTGNGSVQDVVLQAIEDILRQNSNDSLKAASQICANETAKDEAGRTLLHWAAAENAVDATKKLCEIAGGEKGLLECKTKGGNTPLARAAAYGSDEVIRVLLQYKADLTTVNDEKCTPLIRAARWGHSRTVELLLKHGSPVDRRDSSGRSAFDWAQYKQFTDVVDQLDKARKAQIASNIASLAAGKTKKKETRSSTTADAGVASTSQTQTATTQASHSHTTSHQQDTSGEQGSASSATTTKADVGEPSTVSTGRSQTAASQHQRATTAKQQRTSASSHRSSNTTVSRKESPTPSAAANQASSQTSVSASTPPPPPPTPSSGGGSSRDVNGGETTPPPPPPGEPRKSSQARTKLHGNGEAKPTTSSMKLSASSRQESAPAHMSSEPGSSLAGGRHDTSGGNGLVNQYSEAGISESEEDSDFVDPKQPGAPPARLTSRSICSSGGSRFGMPMRVEGWLAKHGHIIKKLEKSLVCARVANDVVLC
eukprot:gb/GECG01008182.1/.p1 GENE.gb/GECG01008182.1/~~gb/GECG01008182.1/.p1  ORF type:complete len:495 (+),score=63.27 gb/GECG01008182.1/:1-1485(+)